MKQSVHGRASNTEEIDIKVERILNGMIEVFLHSSSFMIILFFVQQEAKHLNTCSDGGQRCQCCLGDLILYIYMYIEKYEKILKMDIQMWQYCRWNPKWDDWCWSKLSNIASLISGFVFYVVVISSLVNTQ